MLDDIGIAEVRPTREAVAILVGPNGSGKSNYLRALAIHCRDYRAVNIICNSTHDRFVGLRGVPRISAKVPAHSPQATVKRALISALGSSDSRFYQIGAILEYCGYQPGFGFRLDRSRWGRTGKYDYLAQDTVASSYEGTSDYEAGRSFAERTPAEELIWIDPTRQASEFSQARDFVSVLKNEKLLRQNGVIKSTSVFLQRKDGIEIELGRASSGELSLICSLIFLITTIGRDPVIIIDEPENSLHPKWQREYVEKILTAVSYNNASIIIATHAPLIVTGALAKFSDQLSVYQIAKSHPRRLKLESTAADTSSIEEILWRAFDVVTPANHFISEEIVEAISELERGQTNKEGVYGLIDKIKSQSFDEKQIQFLDAVKPLVDKVDSNDKDEPTIRND